ncbi:MAG: DUF1501 domain-containing protein [Zavarzinella sp.]
MLTLQTNSRHTNCEGTSRRDFIRIGALGMGALTLPDLLRARAASTVAGSSSKNTSVIWVWLSGGPTHVETFDPKMDAPVEYRSMTGSVKTKIPGLELGGSFSQMAEIAEKFAFVRSFAHKNSSHGGGTHWVMTGYNSASAGNGGSSTRPGLGSIAARHRGISAPTGLPTYVRLNNIGFDGPAWLGKTYAPFDVSGNARKNMVLQVQNELLDDRKDLLKGFDTISREIDKSGMMNGLDSFETQAIDLIAGKAKEVFDIKNEDAKTLARYGKGLGEQLLMARRLVEAGTGFVTVNYGGWDMHGKLENGLKTRGVALDNAVSALVSDLAQRGMQDNVLVVVTGEFGRTPRINKNAGRDHWAPLSTLALAGGGLKMGQAVGESTAKAEVPKSKPITPQDLMATVFHVLGIPQDQHFTDQSGRPIPMISEGKPISELV